MEYSVEFHAVKFTKYKQGAPKKLLDKIGRWQRAGEYGGWDNIDYTPQILTENKRIYEAAPQMHELLKRISDGVEVWSMEELNELLKALEGDNNE